MSVLQQNPRIFTTGTDPLPTLLHKTIVKARQDEPLQAMDIEVADRAAYGFAVAAAHGWYEALTDKPVVISKSRTWTDSYHLLPNGKYIACIRDLRDIVDSFERIQKKAKAFHSYDGNGTIISTMSNTEKYNYYINVPNSMSGAYTLELPRLVDHAKRGDRAVLFVRYEDLIMDPERQLRRVYEFLGEEWFDHDLENIYPPVLYEHDAAYFRERTSHKIDSSMVGRDLPERMIPKELQDMIFEKNQGYYQTFYPEIV